MIWKLEGKVRSHMQRCNVARYARIPVRFLVGYGFIERGFAKLSRAAIPQENGSKSQGIDPGL